MLLRVELAGLAIALTVWLIATAWSHRRNSREATSDPSLFAAELRLRTVPPGGSLRAGTSRETAAPCTTKYAWEIQSPLDWASYRRWLAAALNEFGRIGKKGADDRLVLIRTVATRGEMWSITAEPSPGTTNRFRIEVGRVSGAEGPTAT